MKNKSIVLLLLAFALTACGPSASSEKSEIVPEPSLPTSSEVENKPDASSEEHPETDDGNKDSEEDTDVDKNPDQDSEANVPTITKISDANNYKEELVKKQSDVGVYDSKIKAKFNNVRLLCVLDSKTTKKGYNHNQYRILFTDGIDTIMAQADSKFYSHVKNYEYKHGSYNIEGTLSAYNGNLELFVTTYSDVAFPSEDVDYDSLLKEISIDDFYERANKIQLNVKGFGYSEPIKIKANCLAQDMGNNNMIFGNSDKLLHTFGHSRITNGMQKNKSYMLFGVISMNNFKPTLSFIDSKSINETISYSYESAKPITCEKMYNITYEETDNYHPTNDMYSSFFASSYKITGFLSTWSKDNKRYVCICDEDYGDFFSKEEAISYNAVFLENENFQKFTDDELMFSSFDLIRDYLSNGELVELTVFPVKWNKPYFACYLSALKPAI